MSKPSLPGTFVVVLADSASQPELSAFGDPLLPVVQPALCDYASVLCPVHQQAPIPEYAQIWFAMIERRSGRHTLH